MGSVRQIGYRRGMLRKHAMKPLHVLLALAVAAAATADGADACNCCPQERTVTLFSMLLPLADGLIAG